MRDSAEAQQEESNPIQGEIVSSGQCPVCHYSLRGLPTAHQCPECGFEYDEYTLVWHCRRTGLLRNIGFVTLTIIGAFLFLFSLVSAVATPIRTFAMALVPASVVGIWYMAWRSHPFVAVTPQGITARWLFRARTVDWFLIKRVGDFDANVHLLDRGATISDYTQHLPDKDSQIAFRNAVSKGLARYNSALNSESPAPSASNTIE